GLVVSTMARKRKQDGSWGKLVRHRQPTSRIDSLAEPVDREIFSMLLGPRRSGQNWYPNSYGMYEVPDRVRFDNPFAPRVLSVLCGSGRCLVRESAGEADPPALRWDDGPPWKLWLEVRPAEGRPGHVLAG